MSRIFAYITHKGGVADDTALELIAAAKKIDASASPVAIVTGFGSEFDAVCDSLKASCNEVWKISHEALAYPNSEVIRQVLVKVVPAGSVMLVAHDHFGIDLAPGLSIKLNAAYVPDVLDIQMDGSNLDCRAAGVWRPGQCARWLRHFNRRGDQRSPGRI